MKLSSNDIDTLSKVAIKAAKSAGELINTYNNSTVSVLRKKGGNSLASQIVTEVDFKSQELILKILEPTLNRFDLALLTEESHDTKTRLEKDFFWCIDPLDGTLLFSESSFGYSISIALISSKGIPLLGVIYEPIKGNLYHAIQNKGAYKNNIPWSLKSNLETKPLQFYYNKSLKNTKVFPKILKKLEKLSENLDVHGVHLNETYGAVINACMALENTPSCYFTFPKEIEGGGSIWDYAATACIYKEIGACVTDVYGNPLDLNNPKSTYMNTKGVLFTSDVKLNKMIQNIHRELN
ncbi:inositol monophosphatase family protein [uncultured Algibacter sp.]|uniref:3'(2'),5'-bisphosphate nucleotidase CysQ family protein n=1 Tax=uncultured Algibacter sp. TaxID=298659 RepID=UPI002615B744|nr:inositol monophosphatase family protein [uncultured Algibacter sp.]